MRGKDLGFRDVRIENGGRDEVGGYELKEGVEVGGVGKGVVMKEG